jgi:hypothetical protein
MVSSAGRRQRATVVLVMLRPVKACAAGRRKRRYLALRRLMVLVSVLGSVLALANLFLTSPAMAVEARCPPKAMTALDARGLQRRQPFDETHPMYDLPHSLDGGGSLQVLCVGHADVIVSVNASKPSRSFMTFLGAVARDVTGADPSRAIASASQCYRSALLHKDGKGGMYAGDPVATATLQVDCRVDDNLSSFGIFDRRVKN